MDSDRAPRVRVQVSLYGKITKIQISATLSLISATEKNAEIQGSLFKL
jgi:hypothetical protein